MSGGSAGRIDLDLELNYGAFQRQLGGIADTANGLVGNAFKGLGGIIAGAFAVKGLVDFGREAIKLASDLQEVQNVVNVTFGSMTNQINSWSSNLIDSFGLSELSAKKYASTMGAMLKSSGISGKAMTEMSVNLTELAADMASFYNLATDDAYYKVFSGMAGETEPLKQLGVNMSVVNMEAYAMSQGITKSWMSMTQAEQQLLRYGYLMKVTADAQGDFARNGQSWANQVRIMGEQWNIFKGSMGAGFINILTPVVRGLNWLIAKLQVAAAYFKAFTALIFGDASQNGGAGMSGVSSGINDTADAVGGVGDAATDTGKKTKKAAKEIKGSLAGFDQLNTLADKAAGSLGDAGDAAGGADLSGMAAGVGLGGTVDLGTLDVNTDPYMTKVQSIIDKTKSIFGGLWSTISAGWSSILPTLQPFVDMMVPINQSVSNMKDTFMDLWTGVLQPMSTYILGEFIPSLVTGFLVNFSPVIADALVGSFQLLDKTFANTTSIMTDLWNNTWLPNLEKLKGAWLDALPSIAGSLDSLIQGTILPAADFFLNDFILPIVKSINETFAPIFTDTAVHAINIFRDTLENFVGVVNDLWQNTLLPNFTKLRDTILEIVPQIGASIQKLIDNVIAPAVDYILNDFIMPIYKGIMETLVPILTDTLTWAFKEVANTFSWAVDMIVDIYNTTFKPTFDLIRDIVLDVLDSLKKAWEEHGTKILAGLSTFLDNTRKTFKRLWDEVLKPIIEPFLQTMKDIWNDTLKGIVDRVIDLVLKFTEAAIEVYNKFIQPMIDGIITHLGPAVVKGFNLIWETIKQVMGWIGDILNGFLTILDGIIDFVAGVFTGNWDRAWTGVKNIFKGIFESLVGIAKTPLNWIIDMINVVIDGLNKISIDMPDWAGGKSFGVNISRIPHLARGGIVSSPTIAQIGERGTEAVVPLENTPFVDKLASALGTAVLAAMQMGNNNNNQQSGIQQNQEIVMQMDGTVLARLLAPLLAKEQQRTGTSVIRNVTSTT